MPIQQQPLFGLGAIQPLRQPENARDLTIQQRFEEFHALNPWVIEELALLTADCAEKGFGRIGIGMLFELLRYRYGAATRGDELALNNDYRSRYARLLLADYPEWISLFEVRALRAD